MCTVLFKLCRCVLHACSCTSVQLHVVPDTCVYSVPMEAWGSYCVASSIVSTFYIEVESLADPGAHRYWLGLASQLSLGSPFLRPKFWIRNGLPTFPGRRQVVKERWDSWDTEGHRESYRANRRGLTKRSRRKKPPLSYTFPLSSWMLLIGHIWLQDIVDRCSWVKSSRAQSRMETSKRRWHQAISKHSQTQPQPQVSGVSTINLTKASQNPDFRHFVSECLWANELTTEPQTHHL